MLPVVVAQVATLLEHPFAASDAALKVQLRGLCTSITNSDRLVPNFRHIFNRFRVEEADIPSALTDVGDDAHLVEVNDRIIVKKSYKGDRILILLFVLILSFFDRVSHFNIK